MRRSMMGFTIVSSICRKNRRLTSEIKKHIKVNVEDQPSAFHGAFPLEIPTNNETRKIINVTRPQRSKEWMIFRNVLFKITHPIRSVKAPTGRLMKKIHFQLI